MFSRIPKSTLVPIAFASVYLFWGSTYAAIHVAGEHLAAPVVSATRSLLSAVIIGLICLLRGQSLRVPRGEWWKLVIVGLLLMSGNNMLLTWGEQMMPSGMSALIASTMPIMIALMESVIPRGESLTARGWLGTLVGTAGILLLVWPSLHDHVADGRSRPLLGVIVLLVSTSMFAVGAVLSRRFHFQANTFVATGWQVGAAGIFNALVATVSGGFHHAQWTRSGVMAIIYLAIFGSIFGLVALTYLLQNVPVTKVATYAFVNPVIAVLLGVLLFGERLSPLELGGMAVVVCGVATVVFSRTAGVPREIVGTAGQALE